VAALASLAALMLAACGNDRLPANELRSRATRICEAAGKRTDVIPAPGSPAQGAGFLQKGLATLRPELSALKGLKPPTDLDQVYTTAIDAFSHKVTALEGALSQLNSGADPISAFKQLQQQLAPIEAAENGAWQALQIPACVNR
jgi:hypothetical protein